VDSHVAKTTTNISAKLYILIYIPDVIVLLKAWWRLRVSEAVPAELQLSNAQVRRGWSLDTISIALLALLA
jgi:hypothetical protein